jgi:hypothetical protein
MTDTGSMRDNRAALEQLRAGLFGARTPTTDDAAPSLVVAREGQHVGPGVISDEQRLRDFALRLFDKDYRAYQQDLPTDEELA